MAQRIGTEDEEVRIRRLVRDELRRSCPPPPTSSTVLYSSTQQMVRAAASSVQQEQQSGNVLPPVSSSSAVSSHNQHSRPMQTMLSTRPASGFVFRGGKRKASPNHPYRFGKGRQASSTSTTGSREKVKTVEALLLDENLDKGLDKYRFDENMVVGSWYVDILPNSSEMDIRNILCNVFKLKLPLIKENDFEFIKVVRNVVTEPEIAPSLEWNSLRLKALIGQGKLYTRLKYLTAQSLTFVEEDDLDDSLTTVEMRDLDSVPPSTPPPTNVPTIETSPVRRPSSSRSTSSSASASYSGNNSSSLITLSPRLNLRPSTSSTSSMDRVESVQSLVNDLLDNQLSTTFTTLDASLDHLNAKLTGDVERLKIDPEYILSDALAYFKSNKFDTTVPLKIVYKNQPAVDTGGVLKQFFTDLFDAFESGREGLPALFCGESGHKMPSYDSAIGNADLMETVGKVLAHGIAQAGFGIGTLSPAIYHYLSTGDLLQSVDYLSVQDVVNAKARYYIEKLTGDEPNYEEIGAEDGFCELMDECELHMVLNGSTVLKILQSLMVHFVLSKRKVVLDQLRKGLKTLGVLDQIESHKLLYENLFVAKQLYTAADVIDVIQFEDNADSNSKYFTTRFIEESTSDRLKQLILFANGCKFLPRAKINVTFSARDGAFSSICTNKLNLPLVSTYEHFESYIVSIINPVGKLGKQFTSV